MTNSNKQFNAALIAQKFKENCNRFYQLLQQVNQDELKDLVQNLRQELKTYQDEGIIKVVFVGQYSAGKSTIISASTGNRDIKIDADIATDKTTIYDWNSIKLIDTPGLFTERKDHDTITYQAIEKADLLVFCLTSMLFDTITIENFKKLAYEKGYRWKMMLVVNKFSDEAGEDQDKITNYTYSLTESLKPYQLNEFPLCFIDAKEYCEGIDEDDNFLIELSRFETFIDTLNQFVEKRASLVRFDTPVRIALGYVNEAQEICTRNNNEDSAFFALLNQLARKARNRRNSVRNKVKSIALKMTSNIANEGIILADAVGTSEDFTRLNQQSELNVKQHYEKAGQQLQAVIDSAIEDIRTEVEEVFRGNLFQTFVTCLEYNQEISNQNISDRLDIERLRQQINWLTAIGETAGIKITNLATRELFKTAPKQGFLRSIDVAGSTLHKTVVSVGKFVGFKFKPWQGVRIAKNIGNAAKFVGPALALIAVGLDVMDIHQERKREQEMADIRRNITSQFQKVAKDLETQFELSMYEFENQVYGEIEKQINQARQQEEKSVSNSNELVKQLSVIRQNFEVILDYIKRASASKI